MQIICGIYAENMLKEYAEICNGYAFNMYSTCKYMHLNICLIYADTCSIHA